MEKKYLQLKDISAYSIAFDLSNYVWDIVMRWSILAQKTIGAQFVNAVDSISANIAEGFGRYQKKDKIRFYRISYGSIMEALDWNEKAKIRNLLQEDEYRHILAELQKLPRDVNSLIKFTDQKLKQ